MMNRKRKILVCEKSQNVYIKVLYKSEPKRKKKKSNAMENKQHKDFPLSDAGGEVELE